MHVRMYARTHARTHVHHCWVPDNKAKHISPDSSCSLQVPCRCRDDWRKTASQQLRLKVMAGYNFCDRKITIIPRGNWCLLLLGLGLHGEPAASKQANLRIGTSWEMRVTAHFWHFEMQTQCSFLGLSWSYCSDSKELRQDDPGFLSMCLLFFFLIFEESTFFLFSPSTQEVKAGGLQVWG